MISLCNIDQMFLRYFCYKIQSLKFNAYIYDKCDSIMNIQEMILLRQTHHSQNAVIDRSKIVCIVIIIKCLLFYEPCDDNDLHVRCCAGVKITGTP